MQFFQQIINGIMIGSVYALIALGYTMVYGIIKLINFAHGDILMIGAFVGYFTLMAFGLTPMGFLLAFLFAIVFAAFCGVVIERTCYKPLRNAPRMNVLITAIGVSIALESIARVIPFMGPIPKEFPTIHDVTYNFLELSVSRIQLIEVSIAVFLMIMLNFIVNYTKIGKAMKAVSYDKEAAAMVGIDVNWIISFTFALGAGLAGAAGILFCVAYPRVEPYMGMVPGLKAFIAAVLGGIGIIPGAMLGGFIMGIVETLTIGFISSKMADAVVFGVLIIVLLIKPSGILGKSQREKV